jgi:alanyl-tRNA synthetase
LRVLVQQVDGGSIEVLRRAVDTLRQATNANVVVLGAGTPEGTSVFLVASSDDAATRAGINASDVIRQIAPIVGGKGGGRPDFAQGGGPQADRLTEALAASVVLVEQRLGAGQVRR